MQPHAALQGKGSPTQVACFPAKVYLTTLCVSISGSMRQYAVVCGQQDQSPLKYTHTHTHTHYSPLLSNNVTGIYTGIFNHAPSSQPAVRRADRQSDKNKPSWRWAKKSSCHRTAKTSLTRLCSKKGCPLRESEMSTQLCPIALSVNRLW